MSSVRTKKQILRLGILLAGILFFPADTRAAVFYFEPEFINLKPEQEFVVSVRVDTKGEADNAFSGDIVFPENIELISTSLEHSIVSTWIMSPKKSGNSVSFLGIVPGGFSGVVDSFTGEIGPGVLFSMRFKSVKDGAGKIEFVDGKALRNDGVATPENLVLHFSTVAIAENASVSIAPAVGTDTFPPERFSPKITTHKSVYGGKYFLAFDTIDKDSSVESYYVKEGRREWTEAESPYLLADQTLRSKIWVKAVDSSGNVRVEHLRRAVRPVFSIFFVLIPLTFAILYILNRQKNGKNEKTSF